MITHDVDEAIYLADKIVLMTNGPRAQVAEIVVNPLRPSACGPICTTIPTSRRCETT